MTLNDQKCAFSEAWLRAIAAAAGFGVQNGTCPDDQSVDISITSKLNGIARNPRLDVQLKCTAQPVYPAQPIHFALPQNNYDDLRDINTAVPKILVLLVVPPDAGDWLEVTDQKIEMYQAAWWASLRGMPETPNATTTTLRIPPTQLFTPAALGNIMKSLAAGLQL